jgi:hypothetical protein
MGRLCSLHIHLHFFDVTLLSSRSHPHLGRYKINSSAPVSTPVSIYQLPHLRVLHLPTLESTWIQEIRETLIADGLSSRQRSKTHANQQTSLPQCPDWLDPAIFDRTPPTPATISEQPRPQSTRSTCQRHSRKFDRPQQPPPTLSGSDPFRQGCLKTRTESLFLDIYSSLGSRLIKSTNGV